MKKILAKIIICCVGLFAILGVIIVAGWTGVAIIVAIVLFIWSVDELS